MRIALFFDHRVPYTTGYYIRLGLEQVCLVDVYFPWQAEKLPQRDYNLYLCVDDSSHHFYLVGLKPSAFWIMDSHMTYRADLIMARRFDHVFVNDRGDAERFRREGLTNTHWLPVACDPTIHGQTGDEKIYDVAFIGSDGWGRRRRLLDLLRKEFPKSFIGKAPHTELGKIYSQTKLAFNCSIRHDLNMRIFEAMCAGSCLIANADASGLLDLFVPGKHLVVYRNEDEVIPLVKHYLLANDERDAIAKAGRAEVLQHHTYSHRVAALLQTVFLKKSDLETSQLNFSHSDLIDTMSIKVLEFAYKVEYHLHQITGL